MNIDKEIGGGAKSRRLEMSLNRIVLAIGLVSLVIGIVSRFMLAPIPPFGLEAKALLGFANSCFLLSIALGLMQCKK